MINEIQEITWPVVEAARAAGEASPILTAAAESATGITDKFAALIGAGLSVGLAGVGVGLGQGYAAAKLAESVARNPEMKGKIQSSAIVGMAISESAVIYGLVVAIILIFVA